MYYREHGGVCVRSNSVKDFSVNVNPFAPSPWVYKKLYQSIKLIKYYPDQYAYNFRHVLSCEYQLEPENFIIGNGSVELIYLLINTLSINYTTVLIFAPTFSEYQYSARAYNMRIEYLFYREEEEFKFNFAIKDIPKDAQIVFICNPNNPTGRLIKKERLVEFIDFFKDKIFVIDESFLDFVEDGDKDSLIWDINKYKNVVVIKSLTKFWGLCGLRVGFLSANKDIIKLLSIRQPPWSVNILVQNLPEIIFTKNKDFKSTIQHKITKLRRQFIYELSKNIDFILPFPSQTNFILCKIITSNLSSYQLCKALEEDDIYIRNCDDFVGLDKTRFIRVSLRKEKDNLLLIKSLSRLKKL